MLTAPIITDTRETLSYYLSTFGLLPFDLLGSSSPRKYGKR